MTRRRYSDRGSASAEFAVALPAIVAVIAVGAAALMVGSTHVRLQDAAADAARLVSRGEPDRAAGVVASSVAGAAAVIGSDGDLVCVTATAEVRVAAVVVPVMARSCALDGGL